MSVLCNFIMITRIVRGYIASSQISRLSSSRLSQDRNEASLNYGYSVGFPVMLIRIPNNNDHP